MELLKVIAAFFFGGLAGAVFTFFVSRQRNRVDFVIKVSEKFLENYDEIGKAKGILESDGPLAADKTSELNLVRKTGDWFELIAIYNDSGYLSKNLLDKTGLLEELRKFHKLVTRHKNGMGSPFNDAWLWWPHFHKLILSLKD